MEKVPVLLSKSGHFSLVKILIKILDTRSREKAPEIEKNVKQISHFLPKLQNVALGHRWHPRSGKYWKPLSQESLLTDYTALLMDFLSSIIVSNNIVSDYPVLRSQIFAKLSQSLFLTDIETRCYFSLLQTGPRSSFLKLVSSCYFFPRTDDGRICWKFQISPWQRQNHCYVCFVQASNIFNLLSHKISQKKIHSEARRASRKWEAKWIVDSEGKRESAKSKFNEVTSWSCSFGSARKRWKRGNVGVRPSWCGANQSQRGGRVVSAFENYGTTFISIST